MRDFVVLLIIFGSIPIILRYPHVGILMWSWVSYMNPHRYTWSFAYDFPVAMVIGIATLVSWLISREPKSFPLTGVTVLLGLLTVWISITTAVGIHPDLSYPKWDRSMKILVMTFATLALIRGQGRINALVWVIVASVGFYGVKSGLWVLRGGASGGLAWGPPDSFFQDNNALAMTLVMVMPLMHYLQLQAGQRWLRWAMGAAIILSAAAVIGTYSRGAFVTGIVVAMFFLLKSRRRALLIPATLAVLAFVALVVPQQYFDRMETIRNYQEDGSAMGRIQAWTYAYRLALDRPLTGGGFNSYLDKNLFLSYVPEASESRAFHSIYFEMLGDHGFVGLGLFLLILVLAYRCGSSIIRDARGQKNLSWAHDIASMLQISLVGYAVAGLFLNLAFYDLYYHLIALLVATRAHVSISLEQPVAAASQQPRGSPVRTD